MGIEREEATPSPGSEEAQDLGCTCPVMDNEYGKGYMGMKDTFVYSSTCSLHGKSLLEIADDKEEH